ncbi:hypothetical protein ELH93_19545 [Rhizobium leguminosarum]|uniref:hypothetical protein n=1 Tax=Rhizobium leguminosarum TaxID=384 RepID=UPI001031DB67|nr:hypothetical protein [Rhizobium leguminosarum]TAY34677.1 hypothetical protein ELH93_19545 [Rhizobium leguminosarum]
MKNLLKRSAVSFVSLLITTTLATSAEFSGFSINYDTLPGEARLAVPVDITTDQFKARLKEGGNIVLDGNETIVGQIVPGSKSVAFLVLDKLELKNGAKIITNGNFLAIFVNKLVSEDGQIVSFRDDSAKAGPGGAGQTPSEAGKPGSPGAGGGVVSIHVIDNIEGRLKVDLRGQDGGNGGVGAAGSKGATGSRGGDAADGPLGWAGGSCDHSGGNGAQGALGYPGGSGGSGGPGGDGGYFELINIGAAPLPTAGFDFSANGGKPGANGAGGPGGPGGNGGDGGHGSAYCGGGHGGPTGPQGNPGTTFAELQPAGAPGKSIAKNLDLEVIVRSAVMAQAGQPGP